MSPQPYDKYRIDPNGTKTPLDPYIKMATVVGIPGLIAIYLVYMLATKLPEKLDAHIEESRNLSTQQLQLLRKICTNTATTDTQRAECFR